MSDDCLEQSVEEVLEAGRSEASGSIFLGVDANCNIDGSNDQRGVLVQELCAAQFASVVPTLLDVGLTVPNGKHVEEEGGLLHHEPIFCKS